MEIDEARLFIEAMQREINAQIEEEWADSEQLARRLEQPGYSCARTSVADIGGGLAIEYYGEAYSAWPLFLAALAEPGVADHIVHLRIGGPDQGANGLKDWDFGPLIKAGARFDRLTELEIAISDPGDHNQACVTDDQLPLLLALMPALRDVTLPQAPEATFFDLALPHLKTIRTGGDWRTRGFIRALAGATNLPALVFVDFTDSLAPFMEQEPQPPEWDSTPFADYEALFDSPIMDRFWGFRIRNARLTEGEYRALQARRPKCQFSIVLAPPHCYVSHWDKSRFPYRHLLPFG
jgi:hypothetical protein